MSSTIRAILFFPSVSLSKIIFVVLITLIAAGFEGFGIAMLFPVMDFIEKGRRFEVLAGSSKMWSYISGGFDLFSIPKNLIALMCIVFVLLVLRQVFNYLKTNYSTWITETIFSDIRGSGFEWLLKSDISFYDSHGVGKMINVLTVDGVRAGAGIFTFFNLLGASVVFLLYFLFLMLLSPGMTAFAILIMGFVGLILKSRIAKSGEIGREVSRYNEKISSSIVERLNGIRLIKLSAMEDKEVEFVKSLSDRIRLHTYDLARIRAKMEFAVDPIVILAGLVMLYFSVEVFRMSLAKTGIFIFVLLRLMPYAKDIFKSRQTLAGFSGSLFKVIGLLGEARRAGLIRGGPVQQFNLQKGIRFKDLSFSYPSLEKPVLENVNIFIPAGTMTALVGRSGAGKSTLVDLIPRLRVPEKGEITFDEVPIQDFDLRVLRRSIAFVSQEGFLFDDTVENNVRYCKPNSTREEIVGACRMAFADAFIEKLPKGYNTVVGERGTKLSGGQRQRIILARALLQKAAIIILDEPTSSLDSESEHFIQKAMEQIRAERIISIIIIAHRLSTIRSADLIVVIDEGRVMESGSHAELMHEDKWYADMVKMQTVG